jgi:hypothetical protein
MTDATGYDEIVSLEHVSPSEPRFDVNHLLTIGGPEVNVFMTQTDKAVDASTLNAHGNDVFISYSRKDQAFVRTLEAAFQRLKRDPWVDWSDIHKGEEWWKAIQRGIEGADTFIFVLSPDSISSPICQAEIDHAAAHHKRFLPIVYREGFDLANVHPRISSHNWLFFRETDNFEAAFQELIHAIDTDLPYVRAHTRLLVRAIEWKTKNQNPSYLLWGDDLEEAETWLIQGTSKEPRATDLQAQYIQTSRQAQAARLQAKRKARRNVLLTTVLANLILSISGGIWFYQFRTQEALNRIRDDMVNALRIGTSGIRGDEFVDVANLSTLPGSLPSDSPLYQAHQQWLSDINRVYPSAFPRTYVLGNNDQILWVGDVSRKVRAMRATQFLDSYDARHREAHVFDDKEVVVTTPYTDELGRWISASGPIKNLNGEIVGGMRVDFRETYVIQVKNEVRKTLIIAYLVILVWLLLLSWIILRSLPADE